MEPGAWTNKDAEEARRNMAHRVSVRAPADERTQADGASEAPGMAWSWRIGRFAGIDVYIHATFLILVGYLLMLQFRAGSTPAQALTGILYVAALFLCVVLHEFGHALTARRYGVRTRDITLLPIGGIARLEKIPSEPYQELMVAIAGPAVNIVIAVLLFILLFLTGLPIVAFEAPGRAAILGTGTNPLAELMFVNVALVVFNMLPAFPMDGGRVLRALLAMWIPRVRATRIASFMGQGMAVLFALWGLLANPFLLFIALFVYMGAVQEYQAIRWETAVEGLTAGDAMLTDFRTLLSTDTLGRAVSLLLEGTQHDFPVLDEDYRVVGFLFRQDLIANLSKDGGSGTPVVKAMRPAGQAAMPQERLTDVFDRMQNSQLPVMPVFSPDGKLLGLLTMENIAEVVMIRNALEKAQAEHLQLVPHRRGFATSATRREPHLRDMEDTGRRAPAER